MRLIIVQTLMLLSISAYSQRDTLHIHYFSNGKVSTFSYIDEDRYGKAIAYNLKGDIIYENGTRRIHGSAGVRFSHHENGMVKTARYSSHPDGGIQWYRSTTEFNEKGEKIKEHHDNYEGPGRHPTFLELEEAPPLKKQRSDTINIEENPHVHIIHKPHFLPTDREDLRLPIEIPDTKKEKEIVECAAIHQNFVEVINHTNFNIKVTFIYQNKDTVIVLRRGEKIDGPIYISAEISSPVHQNMTFRYVPNRRRKNVQEVIISQKIEHNKTKHVVHLFESTRKKKY